MKVDKLIQAIIDNDEDAVRATVAAGVDVNARGSINRGTTPLVAAARYLRPSIVKLLLDAGADPEGLSGTNSRPLHQVLGLGSDHAKQDGASLATVHEIIRILLDRGADVRTKTDGVPTFEEALSSRENLDFLYEWSLEKSAGDEKKAGKLLGLTPKKWDILKAEVARWRAAGRPVVG